MIRKPRREVGVPLGDGGTGAIHDLAPFHRVGLAEDGFLELPPGAAGGAQPDSLLGADWLAVGQAQGNVRRVLDRLPPVEPLLAMLQCCESSPARARSTGPGQYRAGE